MSERLDWLASGGPNEFDRLAQSFSKTERDEFPYQWKFFARKTQLPPAGDWRVWLIMAGRGFGKTRAGSEWVRFIADTNLGARIALISYSLAEARSVMVEGESGILACRPPERGPVFEPSLRRLSFPNGAQAQLFSAAEPESLRGPQHSHAWCDEIGKWPLSHDRPTRCWDNLMMGLRLGNDPRITVTTTPRAVPLVQRLLSSGDAGSTAVSRGSTYDNAGNLPRRFLDAIESEYAGSQLARQEIGGELVTDIEGALWTRSLIERCREHGARPEDRRIIVSVDPPASSTGDDCGIVVAALGADGHARVLADCSVAKAQPSEWARAAAQAAEDWRADRVVAEANQGGAMVEAVLRAAQSTLPVKLVHATRGKVARAEPIAALYASGRVKHCGLFPQLEDQMCGLMIGGEYAGPGRSPDRADALVWALAELMLTPAAVPSVRTI